MAAQWGIISVAMVMFDIDEGQKIEFIYPENAALSQESQKLIAYLALPHTNNYKQGDTQYCFRYRTDTHVELLDRYTVSLSACYERHSSHHNQGCYE